MATVAVFIALGGSSYAAVQLSKGQVKTKHIAKNAVVSKKVKDASLRAQDFAPGQLPAGAQGPQGPVGPRGERGPTGPEGPAGSPDTPSDVLTKLLEVDGAGSGLDADLLDGKDSTEFLGSAAKATDSDKVDGKDSTAFYTTFNRVNGATMSLDGTTGDYATGSASCPTGAYAVSAGVSSYIGVAIANLQQNSSTTWSIWIYRTSAGPATTHTPFVVCATRG